ncbi:hypothetical protein SAMD00019534_000100 [Acytostelium subglobosum LB1]|uniref:hypothetical protein n=1 Tax=Acytostelium subglobosum LB1 TaxID=1410327 RepID=UPI000645095B|nr:hypothetical protein SAMD00019534_000100 [Acytostelium subglobosum LB1]GAM16835.1 hypothetical protein SAMD00019534_000100 [Acytostelium subglobosum LB1]|eukprot:XP_012758897.1 hypothetical protein SAMD00019534_000100 [Acytostelium subglobosum LB1]
MTITNNNVDVSYYTTGLSNTITMLLNNDEYIQNESACKMILYLSNMDYMPPEDTTKTMLSILQTTKQKTLVNYIIAVFHRLFEQHQFCISISGELIMSVLDSLDHYYNNMTPEDDIIPIYNCISLLNYTTMILQGKIYDNPIEEIAKRNTKDKFIQCLFHIIGKCDLEVFKNVLKLFTIVYTVLRPFELNEGITPLFSNNFRKLEDSRKILFVQLMERGEVKNKILEIILKDISNRRNAPKNKDTQEYALSRLIDYYFRCNARQDFHTKDDTRSPHTVFVVVITQLLQSILFTKSHAPSQDWGKALSEAQEFGQAMRKDATSSNSTLIETNLMILEQAIESKQLNTD